MLDNVKCSQCLKRSLTETGAEACPRCGAAGCLMWVPSEPEEVSASDEEVVRRVAEHNGALAEPRPQERLLEYSKTSINAISWLVLVLGGLYLAGVLSRDTVRLVFLVAIGVDLAVRVFVTVRLVLLGGLIPAVMLGLTGVVTMGLGLIVLLGAWWPLAISILALVASIAVAVRNIEVLATA